MFAFQQFPYFGFDIAAVDSPYIMSLKMPSSANLSRTSNDLFYSSFTVDSVNLGEPGRMQRGLDKRISNLR
jgi:hypothetical protein